MAARASTLSRMQVQEVYEALCKHHPHIEFATTFIESCGDRDLKTSLRELGKSDFFTKEIDELVVSGVCAIAVHSAKDLPDPMHKDLEVVAYTQCIDPSDVIVVRANETLAGDALIACSSLQREVRVRALFPACRVVDIRGTIERRLQQLFEGSVDGVVVAKAALIRLGLLHLNTVCLPGQTTPMQGRLALVARCDCEEMKKLFMCIHEP